MPWTCEVFCETKFWSCLNFRSKILKILKRVKRCLVSNIVISVAKKETLVHIILCLMRIFFQTVKFQVFVTTALTLRLGGLNCHVEIHYKILFSSSNIGIIKKAVYGQSLKSHLKSLLMQILDIIIWAVCFSLYTFACLYLKKLCILWLTIMHNFLTGILY